MQKTIYTGDIAQQTPVISALSIHNLENNKIHRFMFQSSQMNIGQYWYVPVFVANGKKPGKSILLNTGVHGDELNGIRVIQKIFENLDTENLSGSIIGVLQASPNSLTHISKNWHLSTDGGDFENMNRMYPGNENGNTASYHAYLLWNKLWKDNVDYVIDLHSQSTDTEYPLFVFADYRNSIAKEMAELIPADQIKNDEGEKGTVETTFIEHGIPAITIELGAARTFQTDYINRSIIGINNIFTHLGFIDNHTVTQTAKTQKSIIGDNMYSVKALHGGYAEILVKIGEKITSGQVVAKQLNAFGDVIQEYVSEQSGTVVSVNTGALREKGGLLVRILY